MQSDSVVVEQNDLSVTLSGRPSFRGTPQRNTETTGSFEPKRDEVSFAYTVSNDPELVKLPWRAKEQSRPVRWEMSSEEVVFRSFVTLQEWEGYIDSVDHQELTYHVRLRPIRGSHIESTVQFTEEADFQLDELSPNDQVRVVVGAVVRWAVGFDYDGLQRRYAHRLVFRI